MAFLTIAIVAAGVAASPAIQRVNEPPPKACDFRLYYLPFPPKENGAVPQAPVINGEREKEDSFVVTVKRTMCRGTRVPGPNATTRWVDDPSQHFVTWTSTVTASRTAQPLPPSSYLKGPTIKMGPDGETLLPQPK